MRPAARQAWILTYMSKVRPGQPVDCLDTEFIDDYVEATGASVVVMPFGANRCAMAGRDLGQMARAGKLHRRRVGVGGELGVSWVYVYELATKENA